MRSIHTFATVAVLVFCGCFERSAERPNEDATSTDDDSSTGAGPGVATGSATTTGGSASSGSSDGNGTSSAGVTGGSDGGSSGGEPLVWWLHEDWRSTPEEENPQRDRHGNPDVWQFRRAPLEALGTPAMYELLPQYRLMGSNRDEWDSPNTPFNVPLVGRSDDLAFLHPGQQDGDFELAIVQWRSPVTTTVQISGGLEDLGPNCQAPCDGVEWFLYADAELLESGTIADGGMTVFADQELTVQEGDSVYLIVAPGIDWTFDATRALLGIHEL